MGAGGDGFIHIRDCDQVISMERAYLLNKDKSRAKILSSGVVFEEI